MIAPLPQPSRTDVLWFGASPDDATDREFRNRGLTASAAALEVRDPSIRLARGAVFSFTRANRAGVEDLLRAHWRRLANHGLFICVDVPDDALLVSLSDILGKLRGSSYRIRTNTAPHEFAEIIVRHNPGPPASPGFRPVYVGDPVPLSNEDELLLGRCFGECGSVRLQELDGGLSDARVFKVDTTANNSVGSWTQPYFAKIDRLTKIDVEARKYEEAARFIPFALRPNLEQVVRGADRGVLVGNLVENAEPLWTVARRGMAHPALFNLFNVTLEGWRRVALAGEPLVGSVFSALEAAGIVDVERLTGNPVVDAACDRGAVPVSEIVARLGALRQRYHRGPIHGDLHADNVLVRGADAILIDLALAREGPIAADPALLEVWLSIAVHRAEPSDQFNDEEWAATVERLYAPSAFVAPLPPADASTPLRWLWDAVRHIRAIACPRTCETEYQTAVIGALLRMCMFKPKNKAERFRRTRAYGLASALTCHLTESGGRHGA